MNQMVKLAAAAALGAVAAGSIVYAQVGMGDPPKARVALYRAAPGQQAALLKYLAAGDKVSQSVGIAPSKLYAHTDGDSWDYLVIDPVNTPAQDAAYDAAAKKAGVPIGPANGLEIRKYLSSHTDTFVIGPVTAAQYLALAGQ